MLTFLSVVLTTLVTLTTLSPHTVVEGYPSNRDRIPNGYRVPDPCRPGRTAQNRSAWKHLMTAIYRSAQAETSVDVAADGH
ncbi:hypothetical protein ElyMa_004041800 [Elysia marginata]|uniref:Secreted protein n=1 Tax=Elysia marginata TaxID=1093978 RepID=A0AAV4G472_9GAST|nr:hypothetical protein ElyMa_004041800 [Elysia marginata]